MPFGLVDQSGVGLAQWSEAYMPSTSTIRLRILLISRSFFSFFLQKGDKRVRVWSTLIFNQSEFNKNGADFINKF